MALERHAAHRAQLAEVVELHNALVNNKQEMEQKLSLSTTIEQPSTPANSNEDQTLDSSTPTLSDLQKDAIDNMKLIAELVKQVLVLEERLVVGKENNYNQNAIGREEERSKSEKIFGNNRPEI